jgi:hypothetical protein
MQTPARILATLFQGGGNIPLLMPVLDRLIARGHAVRIMAGPGVRRSRLPVSADLDRRIASSGSVSISFSEPPSHPFDAVPHPKGIFGAWVPPGFRFVAGEAETAMWASAWAENVAEELRAAPTDLVVADFVLLGALVAAEAAGIPAVALMHTVSPRPRQPPIPFVPRPSAPAPRLLQTRLFQRYRRCAVDGLRRSKGSIGWTADLTSGLLERGDS